MGFRLFWVLALKYGPLGLVGYEGYIKVPLIKGPYSWAMSLQVGARLLTQVRALITLFQFLSRRPLHVPTSFEAGLAPVYL